MSNEEMINIYDNLLNRYNPINELNPISEQLFTLISYHYDFILKSPKYGLEVPDEVKIKYLSRLLPLLTRINELIDSKYFSYVVFYMLNTRVSAEYIPEFLMLSFFHNECFDFDNKSKKEIKVIFDKYLFVIEQLFIFKNYFTIGDNSFDINNKFFELYNESLDFSFRYKRADYNAFLPSILLFALKNNYSKEKLVNMIEYSYNHYEELSDFMELNDDFEHDLELYLKTIDMIGTGSTNKQLIR